MWQSIGLTLLVIVATLACVLLFMLCGITTEIPFHLTVKTFIWAMVITHLLLAVAVQLRMCWYVVWQLFLSKFKFLRELIGDTGSQQGDNEPSETEAEQETPPSPQRGRQKSARQRRAPTEDTT